MKNFLTLCLLILWSEAAAAQDAPVPAREAPLRMTVPEGFKVTLFAGEPDVVQPIAMCFDTRGRLWVAECLSYPKWHTDLTKGTDRVVIFEDTDNDGVFDKRTVFADKLYNLSGIQFGFGGVWLCATPHVLFIPDRNGDDVPDGPPEVVLDGFTIKSGHNVMSSLNWGPDGWLYGCHGITATAEVGPPGTPADKRTKMNCGVWRYHPTKKTFEVVAHGTTNPWGLDWNEYGDMFITNCVIDHLWHVVPGGHYERMYGQDLNPNTYGLMKSICDHLHWGGGHWTSSRGGKGVHSEAGGGHAHVGCMIYLGDNWPERYRGGVFMCNLHGSRVNHDVLERKGSTYVARHGKDFLFANDPWFRGLAIMYGPDGGVYISDWCDTGECHNYQVAHTTTGRIYKVTYECGRLDKKQRSDLAKANDAELAEFATVGNEWLARQARRLLQERAATRALDREARDYLANRVFVPSSGFGVSSCLRALWSLKVTGSISQELYTKLLEDSREQIRAWAVQFYLEDHGASLSDKKLQFFRNMARSDPSPVVRLRLASSLPRLTHADRVQIGALLATRYEDRDDPMIPWVLWYGLETTLVEADKRRTGEIATLIEAAEMPLVRRNLARRWASIAADDYDALLLHLRPGHPFLMRDVLHGLAEALAGRRQVPMPAKWHEAFPSLTESPLQEVRERALKLAVQFGDKRALEILEKLAFSQHESAGKRKEALETLLFQQKSNLIPLLYKSLEGPDLRSTAIKGLAAFDDPKTAPTLLGMYPSLPDDEKADVVHTLASRPTFALALLEAVDKKIVPRNDLSAFTIRQLQALHHKELNEKIAKVWGTIRPASAEKTKLLTKYKAALTPSNLKKANVSRGRLLFHKTCGNCHRLFDDGGAIGPDLTGAQRMNLDYLLENMLDPSALVGRDWQVAILVTNSGRTITGIIKQETDKALTVQTLNELIILPKDEIESRTPTKTSMMPENQLDALKMDEVRDLVAYLMSPYQVPLVKQ